MIYTKNLEQIGSELLKSIKNRNLFIIFRLANFEMLNVAATYAAYDFFAKRAELGADFEFAIQATLRDHYFEVA
jgi:hypothetical protein